MIPGTAVQKILRVLPYEYVYLSSLVLRTWCIVIANLGCSNQRIDSRVASVSWHSRFFACPLP